MRSNADQIAMQFLAITTFATDVCDGMPQLEQFFVTIGGEITKSKPHSITARIEHPDGLSVHIKIKRHDAEEVLMEVMRRSGDSLLFMLIYRMVRSYDFGRGVPPEIFPGQLVSRPPMTPLPSPRAASETFLNTGPKHEHD